MKATPALALISLSMFVMLAANGCAASSSTTFSQQTSAAAVDTAQAQPVEQSPKPPGKPMPSRAPALASVTEPNTGDVYDVLEVQRGFAMNVGNRYGYHQRSDSQYVAVHIRATNGPNRNVKLLLTAELSVPKPGGGSISNGAFAEYLQSKNIQPMFVTDNLSGTVSEGWQVFEIYPVGAPLDYDLGVMDPKNISAGNVRVASVHLPG